MPYTEHQERKLYGVGKNKRFRIELNSFPFTIGKAKEYCDFQLTDNTVSRMHARFMLEEEQVSLTDLNSTNGTYRNGVRLQPNEKVLLETEDEIQIGNMVFVYR
jgi:pSer/pThr/pTyr-binding forkhead associated (FHA) protein